MRRSMWSHGNNLPILTGALPRYKANAGLSSMAVLTGKCASNYSVRHVKFKKKSSEKQLSIHAQINGIGLR